MISGWLYDGKTSHRHPVQVDFCNAALILVWTETGEKRKFDPLDLTFVDIRKGRPVYGHRVQAGWRLGLDAPLPDAWQTVWPRPTTWRQKLDRIGLIPSLTAAILSIGLLYGVAIHTIDWAAHLIPHEWTNPIGESFTNQIAGDGYCEDAQGQAALQQLAERLYDLKALPHPITIHVVRSPIENAFAAPGGHIVLFEGLLKNAADSEEVAGVLAHELGHVKALHPTRTLIRAMSIGLIVQSIGGNVGGGMEKFMQLSSNRDYEREADQAAIAALSRINASPASLANFLTRLDQSQKLPDVIKNTLTYISTHPGGDERAKTLQRAIKRGHVYQHALSAADWRAVQSMCKSVKTRASGPALAPASQN